MVLTDELSTEPAGSAASIGGSPASPARRFAVRHTDGLAVLVVLSISLASAAWFTRSFYYFQDDFIFIRQAQTSSLSLTYLRGPLFQHFSPVSRLIDYVLAHWFNSSITDAHAIELVLLAASVLAFSWTITELVGHHWWRHLLTLVFAESLALVHLLGWWTATANILPASLFGLLAIAGFFRYRRLGNRRWVVLSLLSYGVSLCTHEQSWLVIGYVILFDLLVFAPGGRFRLGLLRMWREAWIWLAFLFLTIFAMINYFAFYYAPLKPRATIGELIRYVGIQFTQGFAPSALGFRPLTTGWANTTALVLDSFVFVVIVLVSIYRRPGAWRVWTVFGVGFLANSIMIGANRVGYYGVDFGKELYYLQSPAYLFLLCVGAAFSLDPTGAPYVTLQDVSAPRVPGHLKRPSHGVRIRIVSVCLLAVGLYGVAFITSATTMTDKDQSNAESSAARIYFTKLLGELNAANNHADQVAVLDAAVPDGVLDAGFSPWNHLSYDLPVVSPGTAVDQLRKETFELGPSGSLVAVHFLRTSGASQGLPVAAIVGPSGATRTATNLGAAEGTCFAVTRPGGTISIRLVSPLTTSDAWMLLGLTSSSAGSINVSTISNAAPATVGTIYSAAATKSTDYLLPLSRRTFDQVQLSAASVKGNLCVSTVDVGTFSTSAGIG